MLPQAVVLHFGADIFEGGGRRAGIESGGRVRLHLLNRQPSDLPDGEAVAERHPLREQGEGLAGSRLLRAGRKLHRDPVTLHLRERRGRIQHMIDMDYGGAVVDVKICHRGRAILFHGSNEAERGLIEKFSDFFVSHS